MHRLLGAAGLGIALVVAFAGCDSHFKREVVVHFAPTATDSNRDTVGTICGALPGVRLEPAPPAKSAAARDGSLRFDVTGSTEREISKLYGCLDGKPGVVGAQGSENQS